MRGAGCQHDGRSGGSFCARCGAELAPVTLLADLGAALGPSEARRLRFFELSRAVVIRHHGRIHELSDGRVDARFGGATLGEAALSAVRAALALRDACARASEKTGVSVDVAIRVARRGEEATLTHPGTVSRAVFEATRERFEYEPVEGPESRSESPTQWRLSGEKGGERRAGVPVFVGRRRELRQADAVLSGCLEEARGTALCIRGEAGIGKTRLLAEIEARARVWGFDWLPVRILDFGAGAGAAVRTLTAALLGVEGGDDDAFRSALERAIDAGTVPAELGAFVLELLGVPLTDAERQSLSDLAGRTRAELRREALSELVEGTSRRRPLAISIEDLSSADSLTIGYVRRLIALASEARVVVFLTTRSDGDPLNDERGEYPAGALARLELGPLCEEEARELLEALGCAEHELADVFLERAAGNPLFLEQLVEASAHGRPPSTLEGVLFARIERLEPAHRAALEAASVLGRRFELDALLALLGAPGDAPGELVARRFLVSEGRVLAFCHDLFRDAVYGGLSRTRREALHLGAAAYYEGRDAVLHAEHLELGGRPAARAYLRAAAELLGAYHFERAISVLDHALGITHEAGEHYALAVLRGRAALEFETPEAAVDAFERALGAASSDRERCEALIFLASAHRKQTNYDAMLSAVVRASAIAEEFAWPLELGKVHYLRGSACFALGRPGDGLLEHEAALRFFERAGDPEWKARALEGIGDAHYALGQMTLAEMHFEQAALCCEAHGFERSATPNRFMVAIVKLLRGDTKGVFAVARRSLESVDGARDRKTEIMARHLLAMAHLLRGEYEAAGREAERSLEVSRRSGNRRFDAESLALVAMAERGLGRKAEALRAAESAVESARAVGPSISGPIALGALAAASDDVELSRRALDEGEALLRARPIAHNGFWFSLMGIRCALAERAAERVERHASWLSELARRDHLAACELAVEVARARVRGPVPAELSARARALELSLGLLTGEPSAELQLQQSM
jgi:tetratricopeptide (TPR) repeat protein